MRFGACQEVLGDPRSGVLSVSAACAQVGIFAFKNANRKHSKTLPFLLQVEIKSSEGLDAPLVMPCEPGLGAASCLGGGWAAFRLYLEKWIRLLVFYIPAEMRELWLLSCCRALVQCFFSPLPSPRACRRPTVSSRTRALGSPCPGTAWAGTRLCRDQPPADTSQEWMEIPQLYSAVWRCLVKELLLQDRKEETETTRKMAEVWEDQMERRWKNH